MGVALHLLILAVNDIKLDIFNECRRASITLLPIERPYIHLCQGNHRTLLFFAPGQLP